MIKVLVTGGAGFIGSHVADRLIEEKYEVVIVDDLSTGFRENVNLKAKFYEVNICDKEKIEQIFETEKPDFINHHAAQMDVRKSTEDPVFDANSNILGSLNIIINSVRTGVKKIIYISSGGAVYGEPEYLPVDEKHPINPTCQYGISKHTVEHYLFMYALHYGLKYTVLRYPNVYGPHQNPYGEAGVVAIFIGKMLNGEQPVIFGTGNQTRDYVCVDDVVDSNILALTNGDNQIYNIGTGTEISVHKILNLLQKILKIEIASIYGKKRLGEIERICLDASKAEKELGWRPTYTLTEGLTKTARHFKAKFDLANKEQRGIKR